MTMIIKGADIIDSDEDRPKSSLPFNPSHFGENSFDILYFSFVLHKFCKI